MGKFKNVILASSLLAQIAVSSALPVTAYGEEAIQSTSETVQKGMVTSTDLLGVAPLASAESPYFNGGTYIIETDNENDFYARAIYGGFDSGDHVGNVDILIKSKKNAVVEFYGGSLAGKLTGNTKLTLDTSNSTKESAAVQRLIGGGARGSELFGKTTVVVDSGMTADRIIGGGAGRHIGDSEVIVNNTTIGSSGGAGGGQAEIAGGPTGTQSHQTGNTYLTVNDGYTHHVYGGADQGGKLDGTTNVTVNGGIFDGQVVGGSGGGLAPNLHTGNANVTINNGKLNENVAGGSFGASKNHAPNTQDIVGDTNVKINMTSPTSYIKKDVYGGSGSFHRFASILATTVTGTITGNTNVTVDNGLIKGSVYGGNHTGGSRENHGGQITGNATTVINGGIIEKNVYTGNENKGIIDGHAEATINPNASIAGNVVGGASGKTGQTGSSNVIIKGGQIAGDVIAASGQITGDGRVTLLGLTDTTPFMQNYTREIKPYAAVDSVAGSTTVAFNNTQATFNGSFGTSDRPFSNALLENNSDIKLSAADDKTYYAENWLINPENTLSFAKAVEINSNKAKDGQLTNKGTIDFTRTTDLTAFDNLNANMSYLAVAGSKLVMKADTPAEDAHNELHISGKAQQENNGSTKIDLTLNPVWDGSRINLVYADADSADGAFSMDDVTTNEYIAKLKVDIQDGKKIWYIEGERIPKYYHVTYDGNGETGGTAPTDATAYLENTKAPVKNEASLIKAGYRFTGWNTKEDGTGDAYKPGSETKPLQTDLTLYAQWIPVEKKYTITYEENGGSKVADQTVPENDTFREPKDPVREGYIFGGWYEDALLVDLYDFSTPAKKDIKVYAKWTPVPVEETYKVIYDGNGNEEGTAPVDKNAYKKDDVATVKGKSDLERPGYTFAGWNTKADGTGDSFTAGQETNPLTADLTLYAQWKKSDEKPDPTEKKFTITYVSNGGSSVAKETVVENDTFTKPNDPTRSGYTFGGWYLDKEFKTLYNFNDPATKNITVYAKWTANKATGNASGTNTNSGGTTSNNTTKTYPSTSNAGSTGKQYPATGETYSYLPTAIGGVSVIGAVIAFLKRRKKA